MTTRQRQQPDARTALAQRREAGGADENRKGVVKEIERLKPEFEAAMPRGREAAQLIRDAKSCLRTVHKLAECLPESIFGALMTCAQLDLRPNVPGLNAAYLVPFWDRDKKAMVATLIIGYQGYIDLGMRSGRLSGWSARTVFEGDVYDVDYGLNARLVHKPARFHDGRVEDPNQTPVATDYHSIVRYANGGAEFWAMSRAQVLRHARRHSKQKDDAGNLKGAWRSDFDAMGMKTCVRMLAKFVPKSTSFEAMIRALAVDEGVRLNYSANAEPEEVTESGDLIDGEVVEPPASDEPPPMEDWPAVAEPPDADR